MNVKTLLAAGSLVLIGAVGCRQDDRNRQNQAGRDTATVGSTDLAKGSTSDSAAMRKSEKPMSYEVTKVDKSNNQVTMKEKKVPGSDVALQSGDEPLVITFIEFDRLADAGKGTSSETASSSKASSQLKEGHSVSVTPVAGKTAPKTAADIEQIVIEVVPVPAPAK